MSSHLPRYVLRRILQAVPLLIGLLVVIVNASLQVGGAILVEAGLGFLGLGDRSQVSWGYMLNNAQPFIQLAWWMSIFPGLALLLTVVSVNLVADGLNEAFNPQLSGDRGRRGA